MRRASHDQNGSVSSDALLTTAKILVGRAHEMAVVPSRVRALELAKIVLQDAPAFGTLEMRDEKVLEALRAADIGLATFRKALSEARKDLIRKPTVRPRKRKNVALERVSEGDPPTPMRADTATLETSVVANIERSLL